MKILFLLLILVTSSFGVEVAIKGFDAVAYFSEKKAKKGNQKYSFEYKKKKWLFSSSVNRDKFIKEPKKYLPQYDGNCAWAVSKGYYTAFGSPQAWTVHEGKLYFNYNSSVRKTWEADITNRIKLAKKYWDKKTLAKDI